MHLFKNCPQYHSYIFCENSSTICTRAYVYIILQIAGDRFCLKTKYKWSIPSLKSNIVNS